MIQDLLIEGWTQYCRRSGGIGKNFLTQNEPLELSVGADLYNLIVSVCLVMACNSNRLHMPHHYFVLGLSVSTARFPRVPHAASERGRVGVRSVYMTCYRGYDGLWVSLPGHTTL